MSRYKPLNVFSFKSSIPSPHREEPNYTLMWGSTSWIVIAKCYFSRPDLLDQALPDPDLTLFLEGSSSVQKGIRWARAVVVSLTQTLWSEALPPSTNDQLAELIALTKALKLSHEKKCQYLYIYTDSKYDFLVLHSHVALWKEQGLLTTTGSPIKHSQVTLDLLEATLFPRQEAVTHCPGHQWKGDE
jgi:ribonuclease HI